MNGKTVALTAALVALQACAGARTQNRADAKPSAQLPLREELPAQAREMLSEKMQRHGDQMTMLMVSVVLLSYDAARLFADELAKEPKLARPTTSDRGTLNALLPKGFFLYQDELGNRAGALAEAAKTRDDKKLVQAFGRLTEACVGCHAAYLNDDLEVPTPDALGLR